MTKLVEVPDDLIQESGDGLVWIRSDQSVAVGPFRLSEQGPIDVVTEVVVPRNELAVALNYVHHTSFWQSDLQLRAALSVLDRCIQR